MQFWSIPKLSFKLLTFWVTAHGVETTVGVTPAFQNPALLSKETECLKYICDWKYLSVRPPAFFPFKVTVIEGWRHAILTFIIRRRKRSASFWMLTGASGRGAPRCHITFFFNIFRDALINNSFNLQYVIITPPPPVWNDRLWRNKAIISPTEGFKWRPKRTWEKSAPWERNSLSSLGKPGATRGLEVVWGEIR